jgi:alpha-tubulin suppressor-like RCC1 family protein
MSYIRSTSLLILAALLPLVAAELSVNLTGTITDNATAKPIPNATVRLAVAKATAVTNAAGIYTISPIVTAVRDQNRTTGIALSPSVANGTLLFEIAGATRPVTADLFDLHGRLVERLINKQCEPGRYRLTPTNRIGNQVLCLRMRIGDRASVLRFAAGSGGSRAGLEQVAGEQSGSMAKSLAVVDTLVVSADGYAPKRVIIENYTGTINAALTAGIAKNIIILNMQSPDSVGKAIALITSPAIDTTSDSLAWKASDQAFVGRITFPPVNNAVLRVALFSKTNRCAATITAPLTNDTTGITVTLPFDAFTALRDTFVQIDSPLVLTPDFGTMQYSGTYYWDIGNDGWDDSTTTPHWTIKRHAYGPVKVTVGVRLENGVIAGATAEVICWMPVKAVAAGGYHTMILKQDNSLWACGITDFGRHDDGTYTTRSTPELIMAGVQSMAAGGMYTMILKPDNSHWAYGNNESGTLGDGTNITRATPVLIMTGVQSVAAGWAHTLILKPDNSLWACGYNGGGRLGDGTFTNRSTPVLIMTGVQSAAAGASHNMILKPDNSLWACGNNVFGQLGDGTNTDRLTPVLIMTGVQSVAVGAYHTLILKPDNSLWACGRNDFGQLGSGTNTSSSTPVLIMKGVQSVAAGAYHTMILKQDNSLWACGNNQFGQLGDGTNSDHLSPVLIVAGVRSAAAGWAHTLILKQDNSLWACGWNDYGQLGDGTKTTRLTPVQIAF